MFILIKKRKILTSFFSFFVVIIAVFALNINEVSACHRPSTHREHTVVGEGVWKQTGNPYDAANEQELAEAAASMGNAGNEYIPPLEDGSYDNITFTNLSPGRYRVRTHAEYGHQSDEHLVFESSDGNMVTLYDLDGSSADQTWLWGEKEINMEQPGGWIKIRAYSQVKPAVCSLTLDEAIVEIIEPFGMPDIIASEPTLNSGALEEGSNITFAGNVTNQGSADALGTFYNEFQLDIGYSGSFVEDIVLNAVSPITNLLKDESKQAISSAWNDALLGTHAVRLCADVSGCALMPGLVAHWTFDEGSGTTVSDSSGNGNDGTLFGPSWTTGVIGGALSFDGVNDYVKVPYSSELHISGDLTISAWVYRDTTSTIDSLVTFSNPGENQADNHQYEFVIRSDNKLRIDFEYGPGTQTTSISSATISNPSGSWVHYVLTRDSVAKEIKFYENGNEIIGTAQTYLNNADGGQNDNFYIGLSTKATGGYKDYFDGRIDDVRIYNRVLSADEIAQIYNSCDEDKVIKESDETNNCSPPYVFSIPPKPECSDKKENDGDGLMDENDPGCYDTGGYDPSDDDETDTLPQCSNFFDDDGDGFIDMADPGCEDILDDDESTIIPPTYQCSDGINNDYPEDSSKDSSDPGCYDTGGYDPSDDDETDTLPQCSNFFDDDGDGFVDYEDDPGCSGPDDRLELDMKFEES